MKLVRFADVLVAISLFLPIFTSAEIFRPYVVDEKSQVLFGDSIEVSGHYGLENYTTSYQDGYLNISYIITHSQGSYASYPPLLYIHAGNPTEVVNYNNSAYINLASPVNSTPSLPTDYYSVQINFSSTGYSRIVTRGASSTPVFNDSVVIDGMDNNTFIALANHYPLIDPPNAYSMAFTPLPLVEPFSGNSNVLFIPGLEASRLYLERIDGTEDQLWEPNGNSDVEDLYLSSDGTSIKSNIYTRDIINETNVPVPSGFAGQNIYKDFSNMMDGLVDDGEIQSWRAFPYDWRKSVDEVINTPQDLGNGQSIFLIDTLKNLIASSTNGKVTIVAHSNGGLIAKALLKKLQDDKNIGINNLIDKVDVLILVAVPEIGTAKAVPAMLHGYDSQMLLGWLMDEVRARELGRNMKSAYGLLPSEDYINHISTSPVTFVDNFINSGVTTSMVTSYGSAINTYTEYQNFLFGNEGRVNPSTLETFLPINLSQSLFSEAETLHNRIDNFIPPDSLRVIEVAGWGLDTVASFEYYPRNVGCSGQGAGCNPYILDQRPRFTIDGDKTVVVPSAHYMGFQGNAERYWVDFKNYNTLLRINREHKDILEVDSLNNLIKSLIEKTDIVFDSVLKNTLPIDTSNKFRISIHSPVTLDAYDMNGNHTGKVCSSNYDFCYVEENILNSSYLEFGEGKYINLPESEYSVIKLLGTGFGTFTYEQEKVSPDGTATTSVFIDIPVTTQSLAEIIINTDTGNPELKLDVNGDSNFDFALAPNPIFNPITYLQIVKATVDSLDLPQSKKISFGNRVDSIIKSIEKGKIDQTKLKSENFKFVLEKNYFETDAQVLLDMLNNLLDNLE